MQKQTQRSRQHAGQTGKAAYLQRQAAQQENQKAPLDRDALARCISIWAKVYRLRDREMHLSELQMPSRTWAGRALPRMERFE